MRFLTAGLLATSALRSRSTRGKPLAVSLFRLSMSTSSSSYPQKSFPDVISTAIASLDAGIAPFMSSELRKLYGGAPNEDLIKNQVENYYLPMFSYLKLLQTMKSASPFGNSKEPLFIGISAPQGCGKTTMTDMIRAVFAREGMRAVALSLDDFYLTGEAQERLAMSEKTNESPNELLKFRGNAGTHDLELLNGTMQALKKSVKDLKLPRYDKSLRAGKGDRAPTEEWDLVNDSEGGDVDIVLFEGWMLGFDPLPGFSTAGNGDMEAVNRYLQDPGYAQLNSIFDAWMVIALKDIKYVFDWRLDAEKRMIRSGKPGLSDDGVKDFVNRFMPAYKTYLPRLHTVGVGPQPRKPWNLADAGIEAAKLQQLVPMESGSALSVPAPILKISIDQQRLPIDVSLL